MKMKKFIAVLSVATMAAGLAVGCGSSDSGSSDDKSSKGDWDSSNDITIVPEKMAQEQEERSSNFSELKKRKTAKK